MPSSFVQGRHDDDDDGDDNTHNMYGTRCTVSSHVLILPTTMAQVLLSTLYRWLTCSSKRVHKTRSHFLFSVKPHFQILVCLVPVLILMAIDYWLPSLPWPILLVLAEYVYFMLLLYSIQQTIIDCTVISDHFCSSYFY